jgi:hypothetical protein
MAWTRKSMLPHSAFSVSNTAFDGVVSSTSQGSSSGEPISSASGLTRRPKASP